MTERCGESLAARVQTPYSEEQLRHVVKQVLNGLQWLHDRLVVHGVVVCNRGQFVEHPARQSVLDAGGCCEDWMFWDVVRR